MILDSRALRQQRHRLPPHGARGIHLLVGSFDVVAIVSALLLSTVIADSAQDMVAEPTAVQLVIGIAATLMLTLKLHGGYVAPCVRGSRAMARSVLLGSFSGTALVAAAAWTLGLPVPKTFVVIGFLVVAVLLLVSRSASCVVVRYLWKRGRLERRVVVIGGPTAVADVASALEREERLCGLHVAGAAVPGGLSFMTETGPVQMLEDADDVVTACRVADADGVVVAASWGSAGDMRRLSWELADHGIDLFVAPDATEIAGLRMEFVPTAGLPLVHVDKPRVAQAGGVAKRLLDIVLSAVAVVVLAPVILAITILIKREDRGPVYFRQTRIGRRGRPFTVLKFRSMKVGAGELEADMRREQGHEGALWKMEADPRITKVGSLLRRTSLDELPQFINVLLGQMSLVGPRPQQQWEADTYTSTAQRRLLVRPGITGLWQVSGRSELSLEESLRLDLYYVDNWSMAGDLAILGQTAKAVMTRRGAY